jgi:hypothetical protein
MVVHITSGSAWAEARTSGMYRAESSESEGFIHFSSWSTCTGPRHGRVMLHKPAELSRPSAPRRPASSSCRRHDPVLRPPDLGRDGKWSKFAG